MNRGTYAVIDYSTASTLVSNPVLAKRTRLARTTSVDGNTRIVIEIRDEGAVNKTKKKKKDRKEKIANADLLGNDTMNPRDSSSRNRMDKTVRHFSSKQRKGNETDSEDTFHNSDIVSNGCNTFAITDKRQLLKRSFREKNLFVKARPVKPHRYLTESRNRGTSASQKNQLILPTRGTTISNQHRRSRSDFIELHRQNSWLNLDSSKSSAFSSPAKYQRKPVAPRLQLFQEANVCNARHTVTPVPKTLTTLNSSNSLPSEDAKHQAVAKKIDIGGCLTQHHELLHTPFTSGRSTKSEKQERQESLPYFKQNSWLHLDLENESSVQSFLSPIPMTPNSDTNTPTSSDSNNTSLNKKNLAKRHNWEIMIAALDLDDDDGDYVHCHSCVDESLR